jgi:hypothetical protein
MDNCTDSFILACLFEGPDNNCLNISNTSQISVSSVIIRNAGNFGIFLDVVRNFIIENISVNNCETSGIRVEGNNTNDVVISDVTINNNNGDGISSDALADRITISAVGITRNGGNGIDFASTGHNITGCNISQCSLACIRPGSFSTVSNCVIDGSVVSGTTGIDLSG